MKPLILFKPTLTQAIFKSRHNNRPRCGYGSCSSSGCNCQTYEGSGSTCSNCGHNYGTHY